MCKHNDEGVEIPGDRPEGPQAPTPPIPTTPTPVPEQQIAQTILHRETTSRVSDNGRFYEDIYMIEFISDCRNT